MRGERGHNRHQHVLDLFAQMLVDPPHHAEVDQSDHIAFEYQQIAWMRIGVVDPVREGCELLR